MAARDGPDGVLLQGGSVSCVCMCMPLHCQGGGQAERSYVIGLLRSGTARVGCTALIHSWAYTGHSITS